MHAFTIGVVAWEQANPFFLSLVTAFLASNNREFPTSRGPGAIDLPPGPQVTGSVQDVGGAERAGCWGPRVVMRLGGRWTSETDKIYEQWEMKSILRRARLCSVMGKEVRLVRKLRDSALRLGGKQSSGRVWRSGMSEIHGLSREARFFSQLVVENKGMLFLFPIKVRVISGGSDLPIGHGVIAKSSQYWDLPWMLGAGDLPGGFLLTSGHRLMTSFSSVEGSSIIPLWKSDSRFKQPSKQNVWPWEVLGNNHTLRKHTQQNFSSTKNNLKSSILQSWLIQHG